MLNVDSWSTQSWLGNNQSSTEAFAFSIVAPEWNCRWIEKVSMSQGEKRKTRGRAFSNFDLLQ